MSENLQDDIESIAYAFSEHDEQNEIFNIFNKYVR